MSANLVTLQTCLAAMMGHPMSEEQLRQDVGLMVERLTRVIMMLQRLQLRMEEYVCLKVIAMVSQRKCCTDKCHRTAQSMNFATAKGSGNAELEAIHERYMQCLQTYVEHHYPQSPGRFTDLLTRLPEVRARATLIKRRQNDCNFVR